MAECPWEDMLNELLSDDSDTMSAWEVEFIESIDKQRDTAHHEGEGFDPSPKQLKTLRDIWYKVFV